VGRHRRVGEVAWSSEERIYLLQNWRADVVAIVEPDGDGGAVMLEWVKYSSGNTQNRPVGNGSKAASEVG